MSDYVAKFSGSKTFLQDYTERNQLPVRTYKLIPACPDGTPTHLQNFNEFKIPSKIYGEPLETLTNKVLNSFNKLDKSVGVLLTGLKGTGKSLQLKHLAKYSNMPAIIIDCPVHGNELISFFEQVPSSCVVLFDEFEKVYEDKRVQESILSLLDGLASTPHIFILTINGQVSEFFEGRPSRIRYKKHYDGLDDDIIAEITEDLLEDKSKAERTSSFLSMMEKVNMDMIVSFLQDVNLYPDESLSDIVNTFNLEDPLSGLYDVTFFTKGLYFLPGAKTDRDRLNDFYQCLSEKYDISGGRIFPHLSMFDTPLKERYEKMYEELLQQFPGMFTISDIYAKHPTVDLPGLNEELKEGEVYLQRSYDSELPYDYNAYEDMSGQYLHNNTSDNIELIMNKSKSLDVIFQGKKIGYAKRGYANRYNMTI